MMELSKTLQEDIKKNQFHLKVAIKNHQALVLQLRGNFDDPSEIKQQLADIQKHIISLGEAQKFLVARVKKEVATKSWNNNNSIDDDSPSFLDQPLPALLKPSTTTAVIKNEIDQPVLSENELKGKRKREENDFEDEEDNDEEDEDDDDEEIPQLSLSIKRHKPMLSVRRPSTPASAQDFQQNDGIASSSEDSQVSAGDQASRSADKVSKEHFMNLLSLITKETFTQLQCKNRERKRRRLAGQHSLYTSHWDLTVQRRNRTRLDREADRQQEFEREDSPIGSPPIIEIKKDNDSSSDSTSPSPPPTNKTRDESSFRNICIICRKQGILSVCDNCSATYHWSCLDKVKNCPHCQVGQISPDNRDNSRCGSPNPNDDAVSKVLGDTSKPPTRVSSKEVIERYNRNAHSADDSNYTERLKVKKKLEARRAALKMDLATLEEKAAKLSESIVNQNANIKALSADEDKIRERIKKVVDFISSMKKTGAVPS